jgi:hypothetical protein
MIWVLVAPIFLGVGALLLDRFIARASDNAPRLAPNECPRCGSVTRYHHALTICDGCSSVVAVDLWAMTHPKDAAGRSGPLQQKDQTKRVER